MASPARERFPLRLQLPVYAAALFTGNLMSMISVVMPLWALELGASPVVLGLIISSRQVLVVTLSIHGGALMDRYGPRRVIVVLGLAGAAAMGLFPLLPFVWAAIVLQMVSGFTETSNWIGTQALVGRHMKGHAVYAGRMTAAARTGGFIGPSLSGLMWQHFGPPGAFVLLACWVLCGVVAARFVPDVPADDSPVPAAPPARAADVMPKLADYGAALRMLVLPAVALVILATFIRQTGSGVQISFYSVWLKEAGYSASAIGLLIGIGNAVSAGAALSVGAFTRRIAGHRLLILVCALSIASVAVVPMLGSFALLAAAISLRGVGQGLSLPLMMSLAARAVSPDLQGRVAALRISFNRFGGALVPLAVGALAEVIGLEYAFYAVGGTGLVLIAVLGVWVARAAAFADGAAEQSGQA